MWHLIKLSYYPTKYNCHRFGPTSGGHPTSYKEAVVISQYLGEGSSVCHCSSWFNKASSGTSELLVWYCFVSSPWHDLQIFFPFYSCPEYLLGHISFCFLKYFVPWDSLSAVSLTAPVLTSFMPILPLVAKVIHLRYQSDRVTSLLKTSRFHWDMVQTA